ncbi:hypothetical protein BSLG_005870 [Batrachochytrium salamandrivorans]|nr:hypothetical protein BSLG_005870 [Batrachochytrium salamandrivorans]
MLTIWDWKQEKVMLRSKAFHRWFSWDITSGGDAIDSTSGAGSLSQSRIFEMKPIDEVLITKDVKIKSIVRYLNSTHNYIVQDQQGHLFCLDLNKRSSDKILSFHAGPVASDTSPTAHIMASLGSDGNLRNMPMLQKKMLNKSAISQLEELV